MKKLPSDYRLIRLVIVGLAGVVYWVPGCATGLEQRFQSHINYLASDDLEGRGVGSRGIELAANYIAAQFAEAGVSPAGENGTYFQTFEMALQRTLTDETRLAFTGDTTARQMGRDYSPFNFSSGEAFDADVVFCGYGIDAPDRQHNDFIHADIDGKVALIMRNEPPSWADENGDATQHATIRNKVYNAKDRGAAAVLIANAAPAEGEEDELIEFVGEGGDAYGIPAFHITRATADTLMATAGLETLTAIQERMDSGSYVSARMPGVRATGQAAFKTNKAPTRNVLGVVRGEGPMADEYVIIGAHYDHLGIRKPMMRKFKAGKLVEGTNEPQIHNGADDNASGTSGLIEIARLFAQGPRPARSILFIAFTAEETGLHGSKKFVEAPTVPLEGAVAMLNMDMIGRMPADQTRVQIFGEDCGTEFKEIVDRRAGALGLAVAPSPDSGGRSDHAPFIRKEIPAMHFFSGHHGDYHKPSDDSNKINAKGGALVTELVYQVASDLASADTRPAFQAIKQQDKTPSGGTPTYRVVMGLAPGYGDDGKPGMLVEAVTPEGPADLAGMKSGDRIVRIGDKDVANIYDYMAATRKNKAGDIVQTVVLRDGKEITLQITLAPAR